MTLTQDHEMSNCLRRSALILNFDLNFSSAFAFALGQQKAGVFGGFLNLDVGVLQQLLAFMVPLYLHWFPSNERHLEDCVFSGFNLDWFLEYFQVVSI